MAHPSQQAFCERVKRQFPEHFVEKWVLDVGSLDVNGNNRFLFERCVYIGIDVGPGPNVDVVCPVHEWGAEDALFDVVVSTECFEHDRHYPESLRKIVRLLKPRGLFLFTCAGEGRPEHGTRRSDTGSSPLTCAIDGWADYYGNLTPDDVRSAIPELHKVFESFEFDTSTPGDLYFWGIKR